MNPPVLTHAQRLTLPSERTLAFAISVVLSKPEELTIREYLGLLQQHVARGRRENALSSGHRHLDRSSYWRSEYDRIKASLHEGESEKTGLKLEIDRLKGQLTVTATKAGSAKKRKQADDDIVPVPPSPKRSRPNALQNGGVAGAADVIASFDFAGLGEQGDILMRSFYHINVILQSNRKTESVKLAQHCVRAAFTIAKVVRKTFETNGVDERAPPDQLKAILAAASRAVILLIMGFDRLSNVADGAQVQGQVTYAYVEMFSQLVDAMSEVSMSHIRNHQSSSISTRPVSRAKRNLKQSSPVKHQAENSSLSLLTTFLCDALDSLDSKIEAHRDLFEGFAYLVLSKIGSRLYITQFGHPRPESIEAEIAMSNDGHQTSESSPSGSPSAEVGVAKLEAPLLIRLLHKVMAVAPAHLGAAMSSKTGKPKVANNQGSMKGALTEKAKGRLQRTLVKCVFGIASVDGGEMNQNQVHDCLKMPVMVEAPLPAPKVTEADMPGWFTEEMWRLLGWEILSQEKI